MAACLGVDHSPSHQVCIGKLNSLGGGTPDGAWPHPSSQALPLAVPTLGSQSPGLGSRLGHKSKFSKDCRHAHQLSCCPLLDRHSLAGPQAGGATPLQSPRCSVPYLGRGAGTELCSSLSHSDREPKSLEQSDPTPTPIKAMGEWGREGPETQVKH